MGFGDDFRGFLVVIFWFGFGFGFGIWLAGLVDLGVVFVI